MLAKDFLTGSRIEDSITQADSSMPEQKMESFTKLLHKLSSEISDSLIVMALYDYFSEWAPVTNVYRFRSLEPYHQKRHYLVALNNPFDAIKIAPQLALKTFADNNILVELKKINPSPL